ncbi:hypothetical protein V3481_009029 [Fusarium oxysporum f. sp. vasinfectum]
MGGIRGSQTLGFDDITAVEGDDDLPLQFQYQAGDCRLYYTAENIYHPKTMWKSAKEAIWGNGPCVKGSTGGTGSFEDWKKGKKNESECG